MTSSQLELRRKWVVCGAVLCGLAVFDDVVAANASWLRWVALAGVVFALAGEKRSRAQLEEESRARIAVVVRESPWLKAWFTVWAVVFAGGAVYVTRNSIDLIEVFGFKFVLIALLVVVGPMIVLNETRRFRELGEERRAT